MKLYGTQLLVIAILLAGVGTMRCFAAEPFADELKQLRSHIVYERELSRGELGPVHLRPDGSESVNLTRTQIRTKCIRTSRRTAPRSVSSPTKGTGPAKVRNVYYMKRDGKRPHAGGSQRPRPLLEPGQRSDRLSARRIREYTLKDYRQPGRDDLRSGQRERHAASQHRPCITCTTCAGPRTATGSWRPCTAAWGSSTRSWRSRRAATEW